MGQRARILTSILGFDGWKVKEAFFESASGERVQPVGTLSLLRETRLMEKSPRTSFMPPTHATDIRRRRRAGERVWLLATARR